MQNCVPAMYIKTCADTCTDTCRRHLHTQAFTDLHDLVVMAYIAMASIVMDYIVMAYTVMAYTFMAYIVMTYVVMTYVVMAYIVMAQPLARCLRLELGDTVGLLCNLG